MTGGRTASGSQEHELVGCESGRGSSSSLLDSEHVIDERYSLKSSVPAPLVDDVAALAGLIHARMQLRSRTTGEAYAYAMAHALATCLSPGRRVSYEALQDALACGRAELRSIAQYLERVGLLVEDGATVSLVGAPVTIEVFVGSGDRWRRVAPGTTPSWIPGERVCIVASSDLALELRVFRVYHRAVGGTAMRSITMKSISRRRPAMVELEFDDSDADDDPGVEQILMHVAWPAMSVGDSEADEVPPASAPRTLRESVERERRDLLHSAGDGWVTEYLFPNAV